MYGDLAFMSRFTGTPETVPELGGELYDGFATLRHHRAELDQRLMSWAASLEQSWLEQQLTYTSKVDGKVRAVPQWVLVTHLF